VPIRQITIVGTGLIGGSLGLALRANGFTGTIVGCDKATILEAAEKRSAITRGESDLQRSIQSSDVIILATPVGCVLSQFESIAPLVSPDALITDVGSTKQQFVDRARMVYGGEASARVLPTHPMAGKEHSGIEYADAELFRGAAWLITPVDADRPLTALQQEWFDLLAGTGARLITLNAERHDRICAWVSHLPQMVSTAFATVLRDELGDDDTVVQIGGRALREMTRIAHSPYSMWRDIALTNSQNIEDVLLRFEQQLTYLRENLRGPALRELFESANKFGRTEPR
jgi:prephenate dehydrogenase